MAAIIAVFEFPPRLSLSNHVKTYSAISQYTHEREGVRDLQSLDKE